jgi:peptidoglycan/LPS O-acetylase OafA/YrhL
MVGEMAKLSNRPQPPTGSPFLPPAPKPQLPPAEPAQRQRSAAALFLALLSLIAMMLNGHSDRASYVYGVALAVALIGLGLAVSSIRGAKRAGTRRPRGSTLGVVFSVLISLLAGGALIVTLAFSSQYDQYANCLDAAGSSSAAQSACQTQFMNSIDGRLSSSNGG